MVPGHKLETISGEGRCYDRHKRLYYEDCWEQSFLQRLWKCQWGERLSGDSGSERILSEGGAQPSDLGIWDTAVTDVQGKNESWIHCKSEELEPWNRSDQNRLAEVVWPDVAVSREQYSKRSRVWSIWMSIMLVFIYTAMWSPIDFRQVSL